MDETSVARSSDTQALLPENDTLLELVIGDNNCTFVEIIQTLQLHKSHDISDKVLKVAASLDLSGDLIEKWSRSIAQGTYNSTLVLIELLQEFRNKYATDATLNKFINELTRQGLDGEAVRLRAKFEINVEQRWSPKASKCVKMACVTAILLILVAIGAFCLIYFLLRSGNNNSAEIHPELMKRNNLTELVNNWTILIGNSNSSEIHNVLSKCTLSNDSNYILSNSIKAAYNGSLTHFSLLITFIRQISCPWYQYAAYNALRHAMKMHGHDHTKEMMTMTYFIKLAMSNGTLESDLSKRYTDLTESVPESIHRLIFKKCVVVRSMHFNEYMYLSTITSYSHRLVMTKTDQFNELSTFEHWYFDVGYENDELFFKVISQSIMTNSSMCTISEYFDIKRRKTAECPKNDTLNLRWVVTPVDNSFYFTIESWDGYLLYPSQSKSVSDAKIRFVLTWTGASKDIVGNPRSYWDISRCSPSTNISQNSLK